MGSTHHNKHPAVGGGETASSTVCQRWLSHNQQHLQDDGPWLANPPTAETGRHTSYGVSHHSRPIVNIPASRFFQPTINSKYQRTLPKVHNAILQNWRFSVFLLPFGYQTLEPASSTHRHSRDPWGLREGPGKSFLSYVHNDLKDFNQNCFYIKFIFFFFEVNKICVDNLLGRP